MFELRPDRVPGEGHVNPDRTLKALASVLARALSPEQIFGESIRSEAELTRVFHENVKLVHPDHHAGSSVAAEALRNLVAWRRKATIKMKAGTYGDNKPLVEVEEPKPAPAPEPVVIKTGKSTYTTKSIRAEGDIATIYNVVGDPLLLKIVRSGADNDLMEAESKAYAALFPPKKVPGLAGELIPRLLESFLLKGSSSARRVNVLTRHDDHIALSDVVSKYYASGIDFRDFAWMFKRTLAALGFAHQRGVIHGAVLPCHVLIDPKGHGIKLVDWAYSRAPGEKLKAKINEYAAAYPPEVIASPGLDIYMLAHWGTTVLDANAPKQIFAFMNGCMLASPHRRPADAWALHKEFDELLERLVGKPKYRPFIVPATQRK